MKRRFLRGATALILYVFFSASQLHAQCEPTVADESFRYRFGVAGVIDKNRQLLDLLERPTSIHVSAVPAPDGDPAATIATTETHVLYPIHPFAMVEVLRDDETLSDYIPDLAVHETICTNGPDMIKQFQRTEFDVLFLTFGTEYLIDVHYILDGPDEYGSYWGMYESLDGKLAYQYGSWYFRSVEIEGRQYTYVRHFTQNGVKTRIPGLRFIVERSAGGRVSEMMDSIYREAVNRHGTTPVASASPM